MEVKTPELVDAQEMNRKHPDTFYAPSNEDIDKVVVGQHVKVCADTERFWVEVEKIVGGDGPDRMFIGRVDNNLMDFGEHGLQLNDKVQFLGKNIYQIYTPEDRPN